MGRFSSLLGVWGNDGHITGYLGIEWVLCWVFWGQGGHNTGNLVGRLYGGFSALFCGQGGHIIGYLWVGWILCLFFGGQDGDIGGCFGGRVGKVFCWGRLGI